MSRGGARVQVLGVGIDRVDLAGMLARLDELVIHGRGGRRATVTYANVHVLNTAAEDPPLREFLNRADLCFCDGAGVVLGARILGETLPGRMTGADWIWDFAARAEGRYRLFWLGGRPGVTEAAADRLRTRHPGLEVECDHGYHDDYTATVARINAAKPDILLVGMGTPLQERWVVRWRDALEVPVVLVLGATHDFVAGTVSRGPALLHRRQEWLARLLVDPRRLWRRYLVGNGTFLARIARQRLERRPL